MLIVVEFAVAGFIRLAGVIVELLEHRKQELEVLEAAEILLLDFWIRWPTHAGIMRDSL